MANVFKNLQISEETIQIGLPFENTCMDFSPTPQQDTSLALEQAWQSITQERARLNEQSNALNALLNSIPEAICTHRLQLSSDIADIVLLITRKFFINQQHDKEHLTQQITQILTQLNDQQDIVIHLHPQDMAVIPPTKNLRVLPDSTLRLGGCIINSEHGVFDASIERQIDNLKQVLLQMRAQHAS